MLTRRDREHVAELEREAARLRRLAAEEDDPRIRAVHERYAARVENVARWARVFPKGISLWFLEVIAVMLPWAIVYRLDQSWWGLIGSALVAAVLLRRRRSA